MIKMPKVKIIGRQLYGTEVKGAVDLREINVKIRKDVSKAASRPALTELHKRSMYLRTLCDSPAWKKSFAGKIRKMKADAEEEFGRTARAINRRAKKIGTEANYDEKWGKGKIKKK